MERSVSLLLRAKRDKDEELEPGELDDEDISVPGEDEAGEEDEEKTESSDGGEKDFFNE